jgi:cell division protein FtsB
MTVPWRRVVIIGGCGAALLFAVQGGEYSTTDLITQRVRARRLHAAIDTLERQVDSLEKVRRAVLTDPQVQERLAREEFGMVRGDKEILYRIAEPDSARKP